MAGQTVIQKIFAAHTSAESSVAPGSIIWLDLDVRTARDFGGANVVKNYRANYGDDPVADARTRPSSPSTWWCRRTTSPTLTTSRSAALWARQQGVKVYDVDAGIGSHVAIEKGWPTPA
jgi:3-isopropylmalate/(R)-2-methylmalate dehydratase large subunit